MRAVAGQIILVAESSIREKVRNLARKGPSSRGMLESYVWADPRPDPVLTDVFNRGYVDTSTTEHISK